MGLKTSDDLRCPRCSAHVRHGAQWCTLCFADLRPPAEESIPDVEPSSEPEQQAVLERPAGVDEDLPAASPARGKHARRETSYDENRLVSPADEAQLAATADAMLARLAAESASPLGALSPYLETKSSRAMVIMGGLAGVTVLVFLVMTVLGSLL